MTIKENSICFKFIHEAIAMTQHDCVVGSAKCKKTIHQREHLTNNQTIAPTTPIIQLKTIESSWERRSLRLQVCDARFIVLDAEVTRAARIKAQ